MVLKTGNQRQSGWSNIAKTFALKAGSAGSHLLSAATGYFAVADFANDSPLVATFEALTALFTQYWQIKQKLDFVRIGLPKNPEENEDYAAKVLTEIPKSVLYNGFALMLSMLSGNYKDTVHENEELRKQSSEQLEDLALHKDAIMDLEERVNGLGMRVLQLKGIVDARGYTVDEAGIAKLEGILENSSAINRASLDQIKNFAISINERQFGKISDSVYTGKGFWLTPDGYFASAYHVLQPYVQSEQMWDYQHGKVFPVGVTIQDAQDNKYDIENYLVIDVEHDIIIGKAKVDKPLAIPAISFASTAEAAKDSPLMIWHENKLSEGKILYADSNLVSTDIPGPHGMSGSAIWAHGRLAGIVIQHDNEERVLGMPVEQVYNLLQDYVNRHKER